MRWKSIAIVAICALAPCACTDNANQEEEGAFRFSAMYNDYDGTSSMLASGDSAGIFAATPLSVSNRRGTMGSNGYLTFSPSLKVVEGSTDTCRICAYRPYSSSLESAQPVFSALTDQSDSLRFKESELYTAPSYLIAGDNGTATKLIFNPAMAVLSIRVTNMTEYPITSVIAKSVRGDVLIDTENGSVSAAGGKADYTAYADPDSTGTYKLYLAPQEATFVVSATLENGDCYDFSMTAAMASGKYSTNYDSPFIIESTIGPVKPEDFTKITIPGVFTYNELVLTPLLTYTAGSDQYVVSGSASARDFRLQNLKDAWMYRTTVSPATLAEGASVTVNVEAVNCTAVTSGTFSATVEKVNETTAWLSCPDSSLGFIIRIN